MFVRSCPIGDKLLKRSERSEVPKATNAPQHDRRKKKDRLATVSPRSDQVF